MNEENASKHTPFPARLLTGALVLTGAVLVALVWITFDSYRGATTRQLRNLRIEELRGKIVHLDEVLTMSARMAAATGDTDWERRYRRFEPQLDAAIKEAMRLTTHSDSAEAAAQTDAANLKLVEMENQGFALVRAGEAGQAKAVLFSDAYAAQKKTYAEGMDKLIQHMREQLTADQRKNQREAIVSIIAVTFCNVLLLFTWLSVLRGLTSWRTMQATSLDAVTRAEEALRKLNDGLEKRVEDRTRSLQLEILVRKDAEAALMESEERKSIQYAISRVLAESSTLKGASAGILQTVCENLRWDVGQFWNVDQRAGVLQFDDLWIAPNIHADDFVNLSRRITFARGVGLPGRVWGSGKPAWVPDVAVDANFSRVAAAKLDGFHAAFAIPILAGSEVVGVIEFFSSEIRQPDEELLRMFAVLGSQLGQFFERKAAEAQAQELADRLTTTLESLTDGFFTIDREWRFTYVNRAAEQMFRLPRTELLGNHIWAKFPEARDTISQQKYEQALRDNVAVQFETFYPPLDTWFDARAFPSTQGLAVYFRDISQRKMSEARLEKLHKDLLAASRQAGMAEVATSVLHNVGNVLNSVNVASSCLADSLRKSKAVNLSKVAAMLREHEGDLGAYLASDPKGKQLPGYLAQLAEHLTSEQAAALNELAQLQKNIEHIKEIVAKQQSHAKVSGVTELVKIADLVEDTLRMNAGALVRHEVKVIREFDPLLPEVAIDRHKVLQILVNLVRNANYACDESGRADKRLTVRVTNGDDRFRIAVTDNGMGIAPENLTRIFAHGFTTKRDGHGFGLHSGALAAKEMGGSLTAHSDGPGLGAVFTLELPSEPPKRESSEAERIQPGFNHHG